MQTIRRLLLPASLAGLLPVAIALADRPPPPREPPPEAVNACSAKKQGDPCIFVLHDHDVTGTCETPPNGSTLACRPDHPPGPPPAAIEACADANEGDACTMTHGDHSISGTCEKVPNKNAPLACRPFGSPPRH